MGAYQCSECYAWKDSHDGDCYEDIREGYDGLICGTCALTALDGFTDQVSEVLREAKKELPTEYYEELLERISVDYFER